ncbi:MAG: TIGR02265 family protein [Archangium sp.]|nr:TIGR02265 family protein [Archangium sp.]MDP3157424.1 TIGR02265 family protein [Archangium sp.]MDP3572190.1 TIGR02265 family protein [Archangium sp.]
MTTPELISSTPRSPIEPVLRIDGDDLEQRIALASATDTCKGMFCNGLFQAVQRTQGPAGLEAFKAAAMGRKFVDFFNYPIADFLPLAWAAAELLGGGTEPEALEKGIRSLGRQATDDFLGTAVGKTLLMLAGSDPRRMMNSLASGYKTAVSYGTRSVTWKTPQQCVFSMRRDFMPHPYHEGVLFQVLTAIGGKQVKVTGRRVGLLDTDYEISWS